MKKLSIDARYGNEFFDEGIHELVRFEEFHGLVEIPATCF
jgi:hypothetical protein